MVLRNIEWPFCRIKHSTKHPHSSLGKTANFIKTMHRAHSFIVSHKANLTSMITVSSHDNMGKRHSSPRLCWKGYQRGMIYSRHRNYSISNKQTVCTDSLLLLCRYTNCILGLTSCSYLLHQCFQDASRFSETRTRLWDAVTCQRSCKHEPEICLPD